jgi:ribonucleotide monophosphatase NagD (HAD superfamily)
MPSSTHAKYDCFLFDCDGVLVRGSQPLPYARELLLALKAAEKQVFFITNNSILTRANMAATLNATLGTDHITPVSVSTSILKC